MRRLTHETYFLLEEVLPVLERAQLDLPLLVLQLHIRELEVGDEVVEGLEDLLHGQGDRRPVLHTQTVQVSEGTQKKTSTGDQFPMTHVKYGG